MLDRDDRQDARPTASLQVASSDGSYGASSLFGGGALCLIEYTVGIEDQRGVARQPSCEVDIVVVGVVDAEDDGVVSLGRAGEFGVQVHFHFVPVRDKRVVAIDGCAAFLCSADEGFGRRVARVADIRAVADAQQQEFFALQRAQFFFDRIERNDRHDVVVVYGLCTEREVVPFEFEEFFRGELGHQRVFGQAVSADAEAGLAHIVVCRAHTDGVDDLEQVDADGFGKAAHSSAKAMVTAR